MPLIQLLNVDLGVGGPPLLDGVDLTIEPNERVCVVGRNGAGKSTLLRLLAGEIAPDDGERRVGAGVRIARLAQEVPHDVAGSVFEVVAAGLGDAGALLAAYHRAIAHGDTAAMAATQARIEAGHGWDLDRSVTQVLARLELDGDADFAKLSGGMKRRVLLAQALACAPDLLLLDEPTNHLDIEAIDWLQEFLRQYEGSLVFVTHDRRFLRQLATRIVEIDRGALTSWPGDYANYLRRREERAHAEAQANALFDKKLAQEEVWIRQGIKARRTRNEGRVRALEALRRERAARREQEGTARMTLADAQASGRKVIEARDVTYAVGGRTLVRNFSTTILRGDRIGIIGPNGAGKTTLLRLLLGELAPQTGEVKLGTGLEIAYFDQHRAQLDDTRSALDNVAEGREYIELDGQRKHIMGYLQDFLFTPERARAPITRLSGGERNRLLLARLFARPSNLLVMDEPTNDLDVETLELLEELLGAYRGTLLLVSHDREFLDNVATGTLALEGDGQVGEYVGGYSDWLRQRPAAATPVRESPSAKAPDAGVRRNDGERGTVASAAPAAVSAPARRKLSYKDARELEQLPVRIEALETELAARSAAMHDPAFFRQDASAIVAANEALAALQAELDACYRRWEELEA
ncbi:ABC transporter ATPase [Mizugakiibacter sediminis]|uniref:ATP-binding protein Uup n=1 Tax=Mizugakiibacter sediminis TaxID=1475481 RepID=A0A0K8QJP9_9GAMM|nr:ATP-binding cassette domain-containing protein [Mizugakiibacter sediminis]GAP65093.1 ABC transporter ATPase [Mizugakiibacter sediminis]